MTLHIEDAATEAAVHALAARLGTDEASVVGALVLDAYETLENAGSYAERRNARVRLRRLLDNVERPRAKATPAGPVDAPTAGSEPVATPEPAA
ncbi:hypothetical protein [Demequina sp. NBRC 110056]|uniref:hypothetical protein n=1 Tax=Demequina sp. NBRC 110056 TaxID=1570345 RepID=UPI000A05B1D3|nr:hypothetical protein [Demequina sp. NBRC 110056]